jgi:hypothetical protein
MKPSQYCETYTLAQTAPYLIDDEVYKGTPWNGGVLKFGRVAFLNQQATERRPIGSVSAYAEGIGVISLDSRFLIRA